MKMIILSLICYSFHHSTGRCRICFMGYYSGDFHRDEFSFEHDIWFDHSVSLVECTLRLRESLLDHSIGSGVVMTRYTGAYFPYHPLAARHSEFPCLPNLTFRVDILSLTIIVIQFGLAFKASTRFQFWRSEPYHHPFLLLAFRAIVRYLFGVQSHCSFSVWRSEPLHVFSLAFRVIDRFSIWHSKPYFQSRRSRLLSHLHFGVQSHFFSSAFRAAFSVCRSEPCFHLAYIVPI